jgi:D-alanyl-D-alanine carboxypeptidase (penicillin-binding protein 5/6)
LSLISVILGSDVVIFEDESTDIRSFSETLRLLNWGYSQFAWRDVLRTTDLLARVPILHGSGADFVNARPEQSLSLLLDNSIPNDAFVRDITLFFDEEYNPLIAPVTAGTVLGEVVLTRNGVEYAKMALVANTDISLDGLEYMRRQISAMLSTTIARNIISILIILIILYIALIIRYNIVRSNRLRRIRNAKEEIIRERNNEDFYD